MRKIFVVGGGEHYANWMEGELVTTMKDANLVVFTGGEDVHPDLYGQPMHPTTSANKLRDRFEVAEFNEAVKLDKHIIGICRGSQFLCVANGGMLVQHQNNPSFVHEIKTFDGKTLEITSTHHQAAFPYNLSPEDYQILGWTERMLPFHEGGMQEELNPEKECEIVHYPGNKCLGIQGHPEMMSSKHLTIAYLRDLLNKFLLNQQFNIASDEKKPTTDQEVQADDTLSPSHTRNPEESLTPITA